MKRQTTDLEKIFTKCIYCGIVSKIHKECLKLNNKANDTIKIDKRPEQTLHQRRNADGK